MTVLTAKSNNVDPSDRLHQLDWLRVIAIGVLILFHIGMVYVPGWGFHYKRETQALELQNLMLVLSPWRMGLLWFISGVALRFMWIKHSGIGLLLKRSIQLLFPLLIGVLIVVPPQLYIEMKQAGKMPLDFWQFCYAFYVEPMQYFDDYQSGIWPHIDVNHLWFLRSLWQYSIILLLLAPLLLSQWVTLIVSKINQRLFVITGTTVITVCLVQVLFTGEQVREVYGMYFLACGFVLGGEKAFFETLSKSWRTLAVLAITTLLALQWVFAFIWQAEGGEANAATEFVAMFVYACAKSLPILALLAIASRFLNRQSIIISKLNLWVYPTYIVHQTLIIVVAYYLASFELPIPIEALLVVVITVLLCGLAICAISYSTPLKLMFGVKPHVSSRYYGSCVWRVPVLVSCFGLAVVLVS
jgi:hypothetical protein